MTRSLTSRIHHGAASAFASIGFDGSGAVRCTDADGIGGVAFATSHDTDLDGTLSIDNLTVTADGATPAERASFSQVKRAWR